MSKAMLFKPISYNNDEHRVNLQEKIKWLLNENTQNFHSFRVTMHTRPVSYTHLRAHETR